MGNRGVKDEKISWKHITAAGGIGILLFYGNGWLLGMNVATTLRAALYTATLLVGFLGMLAAGLWSSRLLKNRMTDDPFNAENESFMQETRLLKNDDSFNFPTEFVFRRRRHSGWINVVNPFRASIVLGTPGSGKSYALINNYIKQAIEKGYALYVYDFKFDDLSVIAYNHLRKNLKAYGATPPRFYVINFDDPRRSHRCNPLAPNLMSDITDAYEASYVIMLNLNRSWIQKQGDFFVESPIVLLAAIMAASMSTADSQLLVASSSFTSDIYKPALRKNASDKEILWVGRVVVLVVAVVAYIIATNKGEGAQAIMNMVENAWGGFGSAFGPVVILSLFWRRFTYRGAIAGVVGGALADVLWYSFLSASTGIYELLPGFIAGMLCAVVATLLDKAPAKEITDIYDKATMLLKED